MAAGPPIRSFKGRVSSGGQGVKGTWSFEISAEYLRAVSPSGLEMVFSPADVPGRLDILFGKWLVLKGSPRVAVELSAGHLRAVREWIGPPTFAMLKARQSMPLIVGLLVGLLTLGSIFFGPCEGSSGSGTVDIAWLVVGMVLTAYCLMARFRPSRWYFLVLAACLALMGGEAFWRIAQEELHPLWVFAVLGCSWLLVLEVRSFLRFRNVKGPGAALLKPPEHQGREAQSFVAEQAGGSEAARIAESGVCAGGASQAPQPRFPVSLGIAAAYLVAAGVLGLVVLGLPRLNIVPNHADLEAQSAARKAGAYSREITVNALFIASGIGLFMRRAWARKLALAILVVATIYGSYALAWGYARGRPSMAILASSFAVLGAWNAMWFYLIFRKSSREFLAGVEPTVPNAGISEAPGRDSVDGQKLGTPSEPKGQEEDK